MNIEGLIPTTFAHVQNMIFFNSHEESDTASVQVTDGTNFTYNEEKRFKMRHPLHDVTQVAGKYFYLNINLVTSKYLPTNKAKATKIKKGILEKAKSFWYDYYIMNMS
jgi:hypothetical protein